MGKWDAGVSEAIREAKMSTSERTWTSKHDRPDGYEYYCNDPITIIPGIGEKSAKILNQVNIFNISDCVQHPEHLQYLQGSTRMNTSIRNKIKATLDKYKINEGSCPEKYQFVDH